MIIPNPYYHNNKKNQPHIERDGHLNYFLLADFHLVDSRIYSWKGHIIGTYIMVNGQLLSISSISISSISYNRAYLSLHYDHIYPPSFP